MQHSGLRSGGACEAVPGTAETVFQQVVVRDIRVAADIGVHAHEVGRRQQLIVDVTLGILPVENDTMAATIDYNQVVGDAMRLGETHVALIETFARNLAERCLEHARVQTAEVVVTKPAALANGLASTRILLRRA